MSRGRRFVIALAGPVLALLVAAVVSTLVLLTTGDDVAAFWKVMLSVPEHRNIVAVLNQTSLLYLSGVAAAIDSLQPARPGRPTAANIALSGGTPIGIVSPTGWSCHVRATPPRSSPTGHP